MSVIFAECLRSWKKRLRRRFERSCKNYFYETAAAAAISFPATAAAVLLSSNYANELSENIAIISQQTCWFRISGVFNRIKQIHRFKCKEHAEKWQGNPNYLRRSGCHSWICQKNSRGASCSCLNIFFLIKTKKCLDVGYMHITFTQTLFCFLNLQFFFPFIHNHYKSYIVNFQWIYD